MRKLLLLCVSALSFVVITSLVAQAVQRGPGPVVQGRAEWLQFDSQHEPHPGVLMITVSGEPDKTTEIIVSMRCPADRQSISRTFDDAKTPIWFVPLTLDRAIRGNEIRRYRGHISWVSIGAASADDAVAEAKRRYGVK